MSTFPRLKTGAVMQYPARKSTQYSTQVFEFLDGTEQRYREYGQPVRRWIVQLELLDEQELAVIREFFVSVGGRSGRFEFEDPWDGSTHPDCSLETDELATRLSGEARGGTLLLIKENRG
jgi:hypothetical protein